MILKYGDNIRTKKREWEFCNIRIQELDACVKMIDSKEYCIGRMRNVQKRTNGQKGKKINDRRMLCILYILPRNKNLYFHFIFSLTS